MLIGYARVSSVQQNLEGQLKQLTGYGCEKIFQEKQSGVTDDRPELKQCLDFIREGDSLVITKLDRLARSATDLHKIVDSLKQKGIHFVVLNIDMDTSSPYGKLMFGMLAAFAEFENELRKERQKEGIQKALENGVKFGRKRKLSDAQILEIQRLHNEDKESINSLAKQYKVSRPVIYRYLELEIT